MKNYTLIITLYDSGLPYPDKESAFNDADEWAHELAAQENCKVAEFRAVEEE